MKDKKHAMLPLNQGKADIMRVSSICRGDSKTPNSQPPKVPLFPNDFPLHIPNVVSTTSVGPTMF